ncbi:MAG: hypothetical protein F2813_03530 [Actinobacteria bacterium]|uniref:Unannotated protein n=1 Tax=freshwater metagenome TaxID=449393 RepID=A0A6J5ZT30_9ZZZZ|nr:hypothetical protein [Actinomycetota bacterium]
MTTAPRTTNRRWLTAAFAACIAGLALTPTAANANGCIAHSADADGTAAHPFLIENAANLQCLRDNAPDYWTGQHFKQTANIDLSAEPAWTSTIGTVAEPFTGSYDGNGQTITGLQVELTGSNAGLFGATSGATISNLTIDDAAISIPAVEAYSGAAPLVGTANSSTVITNVHSSGTVQGQAAGGIAGQALNGTQIWSSSSSAVITGNDFGAGGLVGFAEIGVSITDSSASGSVIGDIYVGGLVGAVRANSEVFYSYSTGDVTGRPNYQGGGEGGYVGGLVGAAIATASGSGNVIARSFATGDVTATDPRTSNDPNLCGACAGGLIGVTTEDGTEMPNVIADSFASGTVTGGIAAGGLIGRNMGGAAGSANSTATIADSYSRSAVRGPENATGAILGAMTEGIFNVTDTFWNRTDADDADVNSYGMRSTQALMKTYAFYANATWDISDTSPTTKKWVSCAAHNDGYPFLQWYAAKQNWTCSPAPSNLFTVRADGSSTTAVSSLITVPGAGKASQTGTFSGSSSARSAKTVTACRASKKVTKAGHYRLSCQLTSAARSARRKGSIRVSLRTTFTPTGGAARTVTRTITLKKTSSGVTG